MTKLLISSLLLVASNSLIAEGNHSGGHKKGGEHAGAHWMAPDAATAIPNPVKYDAASVDRGKNLTFYIVLLVTALRQMVMVQRVLV